VAASLFFQYGGGTGLFGFLGAVQALLTIIAGYRLVIRPDRLGQLQPKA
jgi:hypothetical protein